MKINNKTITGIYRYDPSLEFTEGDLVISNNRLFVCKERVILGEENFNFDDHFYPYLVGETATLQDYIEEANSGEYSQKLLTTEALYSILNYYNVGLDGNGIIGGYFDNTSYSYATSSVYGDQLLDNKSCLFRLMIDTHVNNGVFKVHRSLPELEGFINAPTEDKDPYVILRQYTYKSGGVIYRIQEVIDHVTPTIIYRYCRLSETTVAPTFQLAFIGEDQYLKKLQSAITLTRARLKELDDTKNALISSFRFKNITTTADESVIVTESSISIKNEVISQGNLLTLLIVTKSSPKKSYNITVDINSSDTYFVNESLNISVQRNSNGVEVKLLNSYYLIQSAYCQQYYQ